MEPLSKPLHAWNGAPMERQNLWKTTLPFPPTANKYWRLFALHGRPRIIVSREAKAYKKIVAQLLGEPGAAIFPVGDLAVQLFVYRPRHIGDLDNCLKVALDALKGIAWGDDAQIVDLMAHRFTDTVEPRIEIEVWHADR